VGIIHCGGTRRLLLRLSAEQFDPKNEFLLHSLRRPRRLIQNGLVEINSIRFSKYPCIRKDMFYCLCAGNPRANCCLESINMLYARFEEKAPQRWSKEIPCSSSSNLPTSTTTVLHTSRAVSRDLSPNRQLQRAPLDRPLKSTESPNSSRQSSRKEDQSNLKRQANNSHGSINQIT
jgi:hypothetical protein